MSIRQDIKGVLLQWGRVVKDAEIQYASLISMSIPSLQWGRVVKDAEIVRECIKRIFTSMLQWGRVVKDAEIRRTPPPYR